MERLIDLDLLQVRSVLHILLQDRTTQQNIIWATDTYESCGEGYGAKEPIKAELVTGENSNIIQVGGEEDGGQSGNRKSRLL